MRAPLPVRHALAAALVAAAVLAPTAAHALNAPAAAAATTADACTVDQAQVTWGFKESFRSYISGSIARGQWEPLDGATYTTPAFSWSSAAGSTVTGTASPEGAPVEAAMTGGIHFTGHDGLLDTTIANPTIVMDSPTHATLRLDVASVSMDAALAGDRTPTVLTQVPFVDIDLSGATVTPSADGVTMSVTDAPTTITAEGYAAFGNYETGTPFDPITIEVAAVCATSTAASTPEASATAVAVPMSAEESQDAAGGVPATVWIVAAGAVAVLAVAGGVVVARRRKGAGAGSGPDAGAQS